MLRVVKALIQECREVITPERLVAVCHDMFQAVMKPKADETAEDREKFLAPGLTVGMLRSVPGFWRSSELVDLIIGSTAARMSQMVMRGEAMTFVDNEDELRMVASAMDPVQEQALPKLMQELVERYGDVPVSSDDVETLLDLIKVEVLETLLARAIAGREGQEELDDVIARAAEPEVTRTFDSNNVLVFPGSKTLQ